MIGALIMIEQCSFWKRTSALLVTRYLVIGIREVINTTEAIEIVFTTRHWQVQKCTEVKAFSAWNLTKSYPFIQAHRDEDLISVVVILVKVYITLRWCRTKSTTMHSYPHSISSVAHIPSREWQVHASQLAYAIKYGHVIYFAIGWYGKPFGLQDWKVEISMTDLPCNQNLKSGFVRLESTRPSGHLIVCYECRNWLDFKSNNK